MASVKFGSLVTGMAGKLGGHVFQRCGQTASLRTHVMPRKNASNGMLLSRNQLQWIKDAWYSLSDSDRLSWSNCAPSWPSASRFGDRTRLSGYQAFFKSSRVVLLVSDNLPTNAVKWFNIAGYVAEVGDFDTGTQTYPVTVSPELPDGYSLLYYVSDPLPAVTQHVPKQYRYAGHIASGFSGETDIYGDLVAAMGIKPIVGKYIYIFFRVVDQNSGLWADDVGNITPIY